MRPAVAAGPSFLKKTPPGTTKALSVKMIVLPSTYLNLGATWDLNFKIPSIEFSFVVFNTVA